MIMALIRGGAAAAHACTWATVSGTILGRSCRGRDSRPAGSTGLRAIMGLTTPVDVPALTDYIAARDVGLLVLDPLTSVMDGRIDAHRDREVRKALEPLGKLAEETGAAVVGLVHLGKGMGVDPVNLILGSRAFSAVARVALVAASDPDDEGAYVLSVEKSNLGRIDIPGLTYRIDGVEIPTDEGPAGAGLLVWTGETERRVRDIMADTGEEHSNRDEAAKWLIDYLTDVYSEAPAKDVKKAAVAAGFTERTLDRARSRAGVTTGRTGFGKGAVYVWRLNESWTPHARHARQDTSAGGHDAHGGEHGDADGDGQHGNQDREDTQ
jgi:hypothetical protein